MSAGATRRCFVVEVMGHHCGYLAAMGGMATGAERVYIHEDGVSLKDLQRDVEMLTSGFQAGKRLGLMIRNEYANPIYTTAFMCALFEEEGHDLFDVRPAILGHLQQGGDPSPFDRIQANRFACLCMDALIQECSQGGSRVSFMGMQDGNIQFQDMQDFERMIDADHQRPKEQWWLELRNIASMLAQHGPSQIG